MQPITVTCKNCGSIFAGNYCNECGEKAYDVHDKKISHFVEEALHFITHFDSKFFRSFWLIFSKPGFLSGEYCDGKRKKYFSPVSMFLVAVVLYLLIPLMQGMNIPFANHLSTNNKLHFYLLQNWAVHKAQVEHIGLKEVAERFNHLSPKFSKVLLILLIPLSALNLKLLFMRKGIYYFDHLMLAAEFNSFYIFLTFFILPVLLAGIFNLLNIRSDIGDSALLISTQGGIVLVVLTVALKRFYQTPLLSALLKAILFIVLYVVVIYVYRLILFAVIMLVI
jgi:hypothetical protein